MAYFMFLLLRPCRKPRPGDKKIKPTLFHQYSWNSEVETTWISLIDWPHKTSTQQSWPFQKQNQQTSNLCFPPSFPSNTRPKLDWVWISKPFMYVKAFLKRNVVLARSLTQNFSFLMLDASFFSPRRRKISFAPKEA